MRDDNLNRCLADARVGPAVYNRHLARGLFGANALHGCAAMTVLLSGALAVVGLSKPKASASAAPSGINADLIAAAEKAT